MDRRFSRDNITGDQRGQLFEVSGIKYVLHGEIGNGAIGIVRRAMRQDTLRNVAIKFLAPEPKYIEDGSMDDIYRRFKREGERGTGLDHENIVKIIAYDENADGSSFVESDGPFPNNPFILMEFVQGRTLERYIKKDKGIPNPHFNVNHQTLYIAHEVTKALLYLHKRGLVHRDVKPANIFLSKSQGNSIPQIVKLGDFGIVKWGDFKASVSTGTLTIVGQSGLGTLKYMAPEQSLNPKEVDVKSDMYSLGITLYELFTNQILHNVHHVYQLVEVRRERGNLQSRLFSLGLGYLPDEFSYLFELIFDMFLRPSGRPTSTKIEGHLRYLLERYDGH